MELIARLPRYLTDPRWLAESGGVVRVAWFVEPERDAPEWLPRTAELTRAWLGPIHPRIATLHAATLGATHLVAEVDDDRGPTLEDAAAQLADPVERERWAVAQIAAIADGLAAMHARDPAYVPVLDPERFFLDEGGHVRLRAPVVHAARPPSPRAGPGPGFDTARYLSPELALGRDGRPASAVFSLAIHLYIAIAGRRPFAAEGVMQELIRIVQSAPDPIEPVTPGLGRVLARALDRELSARIPDTAALAAELRACVPDAADYDAVISDRLVTWRANLPVPPPLPDRPCQLAWTELGGGLVRACTRCDRGVVCPRGATRAVTIDAWGCVMR